MLNNEEFANRLKEVIDYYALSASSFAQEINFNRSSISHLLSGRNKPSLEFILKVLERFPEVELYWLVNGKGQFPREENKIITEPFISTPSLFDTTQEKIKPETNTGNLKHQIPNFDTSSIKSTETSNSSTIDRIVIFFKDGGFKSYKN